MRKYGEKIQSLQIKSKSEIIKTAVIGASGFIGSHFLSFFQKQHPNAIGTSFSQDCENLTFFDIKKPNFFSLNLKNQGYDSVIIASAIPNIDFCEKNFHLSREVNVTGMLELIKQISSESLKVVFFSSDYVFDGKKGNYSDNDQTNPSTIYGKQKEEVENAIPDLSDNYLIVRLSKTYGLRKNDNTLLDEMALNLIRNKAMKLACDQYFSPTNIHDIIDATNLLMGCNKIGVFNMASPQRISRLQIGKVLANALNANLSLIDSVRLHDLENMESRPLDTSLASHRLERETSFCFRSLDNDIKTVAKNWQ